MKKNENYNEKLDNQIQKIESNDLTFEEMVINSDFVHIIKQLMKEHNIKTKKELANRIGFTQAYITKVFSSDKYINLNFLARLQRVFDVSFQLTTNEYLNELKYNINPKVYYVFSGTLTTSINCSIKELNALEMNKDVIVSIGVESTSSTTGQTSLQ